LQEANADRERLVLLEWKCFNLLDDKICAKTLFHKISSEPEFFVHLIISLYRKSNSDACDEDIAEEDITNEERAAFCKQSWSVLRAWNVIPGMQQDGTFDQKKMISWIDAVSKLATEREVLEAAMLHLGQVSFYAPTNEDGFFIHEVVAKMLNAEDAEKQRNGYSMEVLNSRGAHFIDGTGEEEFELEQKWNKRADAAEERGFFLFAQTLREIAKDFHMEGRQNIASAIKTNLLSDS
jgi:hypothetical protein